MQNKFKWEIKMNEEVNLGSRHRNQYIEKARSRSDQPSEDGTVLTNSIMSPVAETELLTLILQGNTMQTWPGKVDVISQCPEIEICDNSLCY